MQKPTVQDFEAARGRMTPHVYHTPLVTSRILSERTGFDVRLKAELFQRTGSYKIRGPLNKFTFLTDEQKRRGVICSSAGNHAQGVALAARIHGIKAVVCMAANATPSKIEATRAYGAEVVLHGSIWDEAHEKAKQLVSVDKVAVTFGCWTSVSRKSVLPVYEGADALLFYPVQYEGEECSKSVFYTGATPNQQLIPSAEYLMSKEGGEYKKFYLLGTDYVFQIHATGNVDTLKRDGLGERTIVTACPHCLNKIGNE